MYRTRTVRPSPQLLRSSRILLIHDEAGRLNVMRTALQAAGATNVTELDDPDFLAEAMTGYEPQLVIMDWLNSRVPPLRIMRELNELAGQQVPVLVISSVLSEEIRRAAFNMGAAAVAGLPRKGGDTVLGCVTRLLAQAQLLEESLSGLPVTRESILAYRTATNFWHLRHFRDLIRQADRMLLARSNNVALLARKLATRIGLKHVDLLYGAACLHDIGKIAIPYRVLGSPNPLEEEDFEFIRLHPIVGAHLLSLGVSPLLQLAARIAIAHHEWWDGTGYPRRLRGEEIPLEARIVAVADAFDAMTSPRPYRPALTREQALEELRWRTGTQFDAVLVDAFVDLNSNGQPGAHAA